ncbi:MAG: hypothetical protein PVJ67_06945 [Candidatus Pacearchaeota archaeon]|jgi:hypothetical protein
MQRENEIKSLKLIIYKLIREKSLTDHEVEIMEKIVNEFDYS